MRKTSSGRSSRSQPDDIANGVLYAIAQPDNVSVNEVLVRPTSQAR